MYRIIVTAFFMGVGLCLSASHATGEDAELAAMTTTRDRLDPFRERSGVLFVALQPSRVAAADGQAQVAVHVPKALDLQGNSLCVRVTGMISAERIPDAEFDHIYEGEREFAWEGQWADDIGLARLDDGKYYDAVRDMEADWGRSVAAVGSCDEFATDQVPTLLVSAWQARPSMQAGQDASPDRPSVSDDSGAGSVRVFLDSPHLSDISVLSGGAWSCDGPFDGRSYRYVCNVDLAGLESAPCRNSRLAGQGFTCRLLAVERNYDGTSFDRIFAELLE